MLSDEDLMEYQRDGRDAILGTDCLYLGDDPGLGKTAQVIRACANMHSGILSRGVVIVCPASLRENWRQEWVKWNGPDCELHILSYQGAVKDCQGGKPTGYKERIGLLSKTWGVVAFDEAHALKTCGGKTKRAKSGLIFNIWKEAGETEEDPDRWVRVPGISATKTIMMSGTPVLNKPVDIFPVLRHMRPKVWSSKSKFELRYCDAHVDRYGRWVADGSSNLTELKSKLQADGLFLRRRKKEVLTQLPAKRRQLLNVDVSKKLRGACDNLLQASMESQILTDHVSDFAWTVDGLEEFENMSIDHIAEIRRKLGQAKLNPCMDYIIEQEKLGVLPKKLVLFAHHREVIEQATQALNMNHIAAEMYYGGMNDEQKNGVVERFQHGETRVFVGSLMAASVGLTLTAADTAIILEPSYVPAENIQAEDRIHRIGATRPVLIQYITMANTLDHRILSLVVDKMKMIEELFG